MIANRQYILDRIAVEERGFESPCWTWTRSKKPQGYGQSTIRHPKGGNIASHRVAFTVFRGPIPVGMCLDHLCCNRDCCNPEHLEIVTRGENTRRGNLRRAATGRYPPKCAFARAETRPKSEELRALGGAIASVKAERLLRHDEIGAVMGRSGEMVRQYIAGTAEPGVIAWRRAAAKWPELEARLALNLINLEPDWRLG